MNGGAITFTASFVVIVSLITYSALADTEIQNPYDSDQLQKLLQTSRGNDVLSGFLEQVANALNNFAANRTSDRFGFGNFSKQTNLNVSNALGNASSEDILDALRKTYNSPFVQQLIQLGGMTLDATVMNYLERLGVHQECYNDLKILVDGVRTQKDWALRMLDAFGKPGAGLKNYRIRWLGSYDECIAIEAKEYRNTSHGIEAVKEYFSGKYCSISVEMTKIGPITPKVELGTCLPNSCSSADINGIIKAAIVLVTRNETLEGPTVDCQEERSLDTAAIVAICILSVLGILIVCGTLYDAIAIQTKRIVLDGSQSNQTVSSKTGATNNGFVVEPDITKVPNGKNSDPVSIEMRPVNTDDIIDKKLKDDKHEVVNPTGTGVPNASIDSNSTGIAEKVLLSFSVYSNGVKILSTRQAAGSLGSVNGIRVLSMGWVILGHTYVFAMGYADNLLPFLSEQINQFSFMGVLYASVSVDTFFTLSGLLVAYLTLKEFKKAGGIRRFDWFMFFFHRFWRLTPAYMLSMMVFVCLMKYWGSGPMWPTDRVQYDHCRESWWTNLLYINNYVKTDKPCFVWAWYLANDMQFYVLSPLLLIPLFYHIGVGSVVSLIFLTATILSTALIVFNHHYPVQYVQSEHALKPTDEDATEMIYYPSYARMGPYIIGIFTGYMLYRLNCKCRMPKLCVLLGWIVCLFICMSCVYGLYSDGDSHLLNLNETVAFQALFRTGWGVAVCWVVFACATGNGGWINELLSWKAFIPLGRLTYCAYLLHPIVTYNYYMSRRTLLYMNTYEVIYLFLANIVMSYGVAFVVSLAFESPMMGLEKALLKRDRRS